MFNPRKPNGTTEDYMLIAVQNVQADLRAGFTAARDMTSHGNGYGDVAIRNAINRRPHRRPALSGLDPRHCVGRQACRSRRIRTIRSPAQWFARSKKRAPRCASKSRHGADWIKLLSGRRVFVHPDGRRCNTW